jgi:hypothetical protein
MKLSGGGACKTASYTTALEAGEWSSSSFIRTTTDEGVSGIPYITE